MSNTEQSNFRLDKDAKAKAYKIFAQIGVKPTDAVNMFMHYVAMHGRLPFQPRVPQELLDKQDAALIIGIGTDIVRVARIESVLDRFGTRFVARCFTGAERRHGDNPRKLAKRFAAKEACAKALGSGIAGGILFKEIEVVNDKHGAPSLVLHGNALAKLHTRLPSGTKPRLHLTLSDERDQALAVVVIEAN